MLCAVIRGPSLEEALSQVEEVKPYADLIELNLETADLQGYPFSIPLVQEIASYHDFEKTPEDLEAIYQELRKQKASFYKMALYANSTLDALRLRAFAKGKKNLIAISMGPLGQFTRLLERQISFAAVNTALINAPGQLTAKEMQEIYNYSKHTENTALFGLIGDPITSSISEITHNAFFRKHTIDALYVKMRVTQEELPHFLPLAEELGFQGLSVTMPLKEKILPFLDALTPKAKAIGAVNTLAFKEGKIIGHNTDAEGALNAISKHLDPRNKTIAIIGVGGAAKAIAHEATLRGAKPLLLHRPTSLPPHDLLINATPADPIEPHPNTFVMDLRIKPKHTPFLTLAIAKGCTPIFGEEMFFEQALLQFSWWFI